MRWLFLLLLALPAAVGGWWGVYDTVVKHLPGEAGMLPRFYGFLALAVAGTLAPGIAYLNRRFLSGDAFHRYRWRPLRQAVWCGLCLASWAWLQQYREFKFIYAIFIALVFVALELLCQKLFRGKPQKGASHGS